MRWKGLWDNSNQRLKNVVKSIFLRPFFFEEETVVPDIVPLAEKSSNFEIGVRFLDSVIWV